MSEMRQTEALTVQATSLQSIAESLKAIAAPQVTVGEIVRFLGNSTVPEIPMRMLAELLVRRYDIREKRL